MTDDLYTRRRCPLHDETLDPDPGQRAKAARVAPAEAPLPGQQSLFEGNA